MKVENIVFSPIPLDELENRLSERFASILKQSKETPTASPEDDFLTANEVSKLLGVSLVSIHKWKKQGLIKYHRFGSRIRFKKSEILNTQKYQRRVEK